MKRIYSPVLLAIVFCSMVFTTSSAAAPDWLWAKSAGNINYDWSYATTMDDSGNIYITGTFTGQNIVFGSDTLVNPSPSHGAFFLVKYNSSGTVVWSRMAGGTDGGDRGYCLTTDNDGNVYVGGDFNSTSIQFGSTVLSNSPAIDDIFLVKYDKKGNVIWAKQIKGNDAEHISSIVADGNNGIYITGHFTSEFVYFGADSLHNVKSANSKADLFVAKYSRDGNLVWTKSAGGDDDDFGKSIATDGLGNLYVVGNYNLYSCTFQSKTITNAGSYDFFLAKYDTAGSLLWVKNHGGAKFDYVNGVATDAVGNIFLTGFFTTPIIPLGNDTLKNFSTTSENIFVIKYDKKGNIAWVHSTGGSKMDHGNCIATDGINVYVGGSYTSAFKYGTNTLINSGSEDVFVAKYFNAGGIDWVKTANGKNDDYCESIVADKSGDVYATGIFYSPSLSFGGLSVTNASLSNPDVFVAKLGVLTGIENSPYTSDNIDIFPNPFSQQITLHANHDLRNAVIVITNILGQEVMKIPAFTGKVITIKRRNLKAGLYLIKITEGKDLLYSQKVLVED